MGLDGGNPRKDWMGTPCPQSGLDGGTPSSVRSGWGTPYQDWMGYSSPQRQEIGRQSSYAVSDTLVTRKSSCVNARGIPPATRRIASTWWAALSPGGRGYPRCEQTKNITFFHPSDANSNKSALSSFGSGSSAWFKRYFHDTFYKSQISFILFPH